MRYIMPCLMPPPILAYHRELVDLVAERFVWEFLKTRERRFTAWFDNITLLKKVGERDGMNLWTIHRAFNLEA
jgi:hypothetical protein